MWSDSSAYNSKKLSKVRLLSSQLNSQFAKISFEQQCASKKAAYQTSVEAF
jgi:hypothetical protein